MDQDEIRAVLGSYQDVRVLVADEASGAPEQAWGDTFVFHEPGGTGDGMRPFATIVTRDTPGWDEVSALDRPGAFRLNLHVGRAEQPSVRDVDHATRDVLLPHPQYAAQGWVSVVEPGARTHDDVLRLIAVAHARAVARHEASSG